MRWGCEYQQFYLAFVAAIRYKSSPQNAPHITFSCRLFTSIRQPFIGILVSSFTYVLHMIQYRIKVHHTDTNSNNNLKRKKRIIFFTKSIENRCSPKLFGIETFVYLRVVHYGTEPYTIN